MAEEVEQLLRAAMELHKTDQYQAAHDHYRSVLRQDPDNLAAIHFLGILLRQQGLNDEGDSLVAKAAALRGRTQGGSGYDFTAKHAAETSEIARKAPEWPPYDPTTTGMWRMLRMVDFAASFADDGGSWLTIGDAYGHDSLMLRDHGIGTVVASNLNASLLRMGREAGALGEVLEINAESIALPDDSFDYVLCKEAYHHMPRPMLAVYEMLRVARKAVILIEPQDQVVDWPASRNPSYWHAIEGNHVSFGPAGGEAVSSANIDWYEHGAFNYVYTLSRREIRKLCFGAGLLGYATKQFNDFFRDDWADQPAHASEGFDQTLAQITAWDTLCAASGKPASYLTAMLFKRIPEQPRLDRLRGLGYELHATPTRFLPLGWPGEE